MPSESLVHLHDELFQLSSFLQAHQHLLILLPKNILNGFELLPFSLFQLSLLDAVLLLHDFQDSGGFLIKSLGVFPQHGRTNSMLMRHAIEFAIEMSIHGAFEFSLQFVLIDESIQLLLMH